MSARQQRIQKLAPYALVLAPMLGVMGARMLGPGLSPRSASASDTETVSLSDLESILIPEPSEDAFDARDHARSFSFVGVGNPFPVEKHSPTIHVDPIDPIGQRPQPPRVTLTALFSTGSEEIAFIDGMAFRVGDEVAPNWRIARIDPRRRIVHLVHDEGDKAQLVLEN